jgi:Flp pilus assembly pilin Flp
MPRHEMSIAKRRSRANPTAEGGMFRYRRSHQRATNELGQTFVEYAVLLAVVVGGVLMVTTWAGLTDVMQAAMDAVAGAV